MSPHLSCSRKCHCLIGFLWEQHIRSTTCTTWLFSSISPSQPRNHSCPMCPLFFFLSFPEHKDPHILPFVPLPSYLTILLNDFLTFKTSPLWKWYPPSLLLPSFYFQKKCHRYLEFGIYKTSVYSSQTYLSSCILSWLKMLAITFAGKLRVQFYFYFYLPPTIHRSRILFFCQVSVPIHLFFPLPMP